MIALIGGFPTNATAQEAYDQSASEADSEAVCLARPRDNSPQVRREDRGKRVFVAVLLRSVPGLKARGFTRLDCNGAGFQEASDFASYRDEMCETARLGNEAVQNQLARALGEFPSVLCANAERIAGQWQRREQTSQ